jgi:hypothetical protein
MTRGGHPWCPPERVGPPTPTRTEPGTVESTTVPVTPLEEVTMSPKNEAAVTSFDSTADLANALRRASAAHGEHEKRIGKADPDWPDWYADYMVREQSGAEMPL